MDRTDLWLMILFGLLFLAIFLTGFGCVISYGITDDVYILPLAMFLLIISGMAFLMYVGCAADSEGD